MEKQWNFAYGDFPGNPYDHKQFRMTYSDHHPVAFEVNARDKEAPSAYLDNKIFKIAVNRS